MLRPAYRRKAPSPRALHNRKLAPDRLHNSYSNPAFAGKESATGFAGHEQKLAGRQHWRPVRWEHLAPVRVRKPNYHPKAVVRPDAWSTSRAIQADLDRS